MPVFTGQICSSVPIYSSYITLTVYALRKKQAVPKHCPLIKSVLFFGLCVNDISK